MSSDISHGIPLTGEGRSLGSKISGGTSTKGAQPPIFGMSVVVKRLDGSSWHLLILLMLSSTEYRLDKHWSNQGVLFDFNADLTGTGSVPICM